MTDTPKVSDETNMKILEMLIEERKRLFVKVTEPDFNGQYNPGKHDQDMLHEFNVIIKWLASGGLGL